MSASLPELSFVGIGPMRAGTTWLHGALARHPRVALPREKETFYFDRHFDRGPAWYRAHFPDAREGQRFGEIGASYFASSEARARIHAVAPEALLLVSVRDPVLRAYSTYLHFKKSRPLPESLEDAVRQEPQILGSGAYSVHLPAWEALFGRERVELLSLDVLRAHPHRELGRVLARLGLDPLDPREDLSERKNEAVSPSAKGAFRLSERVFRHLVDHQHFRTLEAARALKRVKHRLSPPKPQTVRPMTERERAFLREALAPEYAFLAARLPQD